MKVFISQITRKRLVWWKRTALCSLTAKVWIIYDEDTSHSKANLNLNPYTTRSNVQEILFRVTCGYVDLKKMYLRSFSNMNFKILPEKKTRIFAKVKSGKPILGKCSMIRATSMLVTDVKDEICWRQLWDVGWRFWPFLSPTFSIF